MRCDCCGRAGAASSGRPGGVVLAAQRDGVRRAAPAGARRPCASCSRCPPSATGLTAARAVPARAPTRSSATIPPAASSARPRDGRVVDASVDALVDAGPGEPRSGVAVDAELTSHEDDVPAAGRVLRVSGPLVEADGLDGVAMSELVSLGAARSAGEVVAIRGRRHLDPVPTSTPVASAPVRRWSRWADRCRRGSDRGCSAGCSTGCCGPSAPRRPGCRRTPGAQDPEASWDWSPLVADGVEVAEGSVLGTVPDGRRGRAPRPRPARGQRHGREPERRRGPAAPTT